MANIKRIPADADPRPKQTKKGLASAVDETVAAAEEIANERWGIRAVTPKGQVVAALEPTDEAYTAALTAQYAAEKAYARFVGGPGSPGQTVAVGTATEGESA